MENTIEPTKESWETAIKRHERRQEELERVGAAFRRFGPAPYIELGVLIPECCDPRYYWEDG